jgi:hypothetical protein
MGCLGVHYAITQDEVSMLKGFKSDAKQLEYLQSEIEEVYFGDHPNLMTESDKAWDAMHRALTDGTLTYDRNKPRSLTVIGGEGLYYKDDYIMSLKTPIEVREVADAISKITKEEFRAGYDRIDEARYGFSKSPDDFEYTWDWFLKVTAFYQEAARENRYVLFTADQEVDASRQR